MISYGIVFALGLLMGAIAGVAVVALCLARSERRAGLHVSKEREHEDP